MKTIMIFGACMLLSSTLSAQTQKTEPQKKIDSVRSVQVEEQREGTVSTPVVSGSPTETQTGAQSQSNAVETRNTGTTIVVNPATQNNNLPLQQSTAPRKRAENTTPNTGLENRRPVNTTMIDTASRRASTTVRESNNNTTGSKTTGRKSGVSKRKNVVKKTN